MYLIASSFGDKREGCLPYALLPTSIQLALVRERMLAYVHL